MNMIDKYVYAVVKHLPDSIRQDVEKELRSNIYDMLPESYTDDDVKKVLTELGSPRKLSSKYRDTKQYLIGPDLYQSYLFVLKTVSYIVACIIPLAAIVVAITENQDAVYYEIILQIFVQMIVIAIQSAFQVFAWVTIIFVILDRSGISDIEMMIKGRAWSPDDLEDVPYSKENEIPKSEAVANLIFGVLFLAVIYYAPKLIGWFTINDDKKWDIIPLFNQNVLLKYYPFIIGLTALMFILVILKIINKRWSTKLAICNAVYNTISIVFAVVFFTNRNLFNQSFIVKFAETVKISTDKLSRIWEISLICFTVFLAICFIWDSVNGFIKSKK